MIIIHAEHAASNHWDPFDDLVEAILRQAVSDYCRLGKKLINCAAEDRIIYEADFKSVRDFFLSDWYSDLSGREDGADVLEKLNKEVFGDYGCPEVS